MAYKRNQVEEAISRTIGEKGVRPSSELRIRVKRLLDLDRGLEINPRSKDPELANFAFYSSAAPGKGSEILFSAYEAFALLTGIRLLKHSWPQHFVVTMLRRVRHKLEAEHRNILKQDFRTLFDEERVSKEARSGHIAVDNADPVFLLIVSDDASSADRPYAMILRGQLAAFTFQMDRIGRSCTWNELVSPAWRLQNNLVASLPRQRGRST
jgi:hypothetical protein